MIICILSVKKDLRKKHPKKPEKEIISSAIAICRSSIEGKKD
jgi:hypothetical protein